MAHQIFLPKMNPPTPEQAQWAASSWEWVVQYYADSSRQGFDDCRPLLGLIEHVRKNDDAKLLSAGMSMETFSIASAAHVVAPNRLTDNAPTIGVIQFGHEFLFRDAVGKKRHCPFEYAIALIDVQLVRLRMMIDEFDRRNSV